METASIPWKSRHELPPIRKLGIKFDIDRLRADLDALASNRRWDGLGAEYRNLCEIFHQLPPFFMEDCSQPVDDSNYQQLALTEFDQSYSLDQRPEKSGSFWDHAHPHRNPAADERFYRKPVGDLPPYLQACLDFFRPSLHRARFAKLKANSQVKPHIDYDTRYSCRLHIPIQTNPSCMMGVEGKNGEKVEEHFEADGSVYFVNQGLKHWATNPSTTERVHLILSVDSQRFLEM